MKSLLVLSCIFLGLWCSQCSTPQLATDKSQSAKQNAAFDYPDDMVADTARKRFAREFSKGKILYELNCARCHTVKVNGQPVVPDFSLPQLMDYELRVQYPAHGDDLRESNISHDELEWVVQYLRYRKKSNFSIYEALKQGHSPQSK